MLTNPTAGRRMTGRLMVVLAVGVALPLTATRAINYVDQAVSAAPEIAATAPATSSQPIAPVNPSQPEPAATIEAVRAIHADKGLVTINGKTKSWDKLSRSERAEIRQSVAQARRELAEHRIDRDELRREIQQAKAEAQIDRGELQRELAEAQADVARAMAETDAHWAELRRAGQNPEQIKASIRTSLNVVANIDVDAIKREALASIDEAQIEASVIAAEESIRAAEAELDRIEALDRDD